MRTISTLSIFTLLIFCVACSNKSKTAGDSVSETQSPAGNTNNPTQTQTSDAVTLDNSVSKTTTGTTLPATGNTAGLNPAHGEPGHRCDIAVGSPLNSKPTQQQPEVKNIQMVQPPAIDQKTTPTTIQPAGNTATAPGMNPAHGEPGHRCDITVGAPLNSKPTQTTGSQVNTQTTGSQVNTQTLPSTPQTTPAKPVLISPKNQ